MSNKSNSASFLVCKSNFFYVEASRYTFQELDGMQAAALFYR